MDQGGDGFAQFVTEHLTDGIRTRGARGVILIKADEDTAQVFRLKGCGRARRRFSHCSKGFASLGTVDSLWAWRGRRGTNGFGKTVGEVFSVGEPGQEVSNGFGEVWRAGKLIPFPGDYLSVDVFNEVGNFFSSSVVPLGLRAEMLLSLVLDGGADPSARGSVMRCLRRSGKSVFS